MHWDDVRFFLAVARAGTVKAAAHSLKVDASSEGETVRFVRNRLFRLEAFLA